MNSGSISINRQTVASSAMGSVEKRRTFIGRALPPRGPLPSIAMMPSMTYKRGLRKELRSTSIRAKSIALASLTWNSPLRAPGMHPNWFLTQPVIRQPMGLELRQADDSIAVESAIGNHEFLVLDAISEDNFPSVLEISQGHTVGARDRRETAHSGCGLGALDRRRIPVLERRARCLEHLDHGLEDHRVRYGKLLWRISDEPIRLEKDLLAGSGEKARPTEEIDTGPNPGSDLIVLVALTAHQRDRCHAHHLVREFSCHEDRMNECPPPTGTRDWWAGALPRSPDS